MPLVRVGLYPRVSSKEQVEGYSIEEQIDKLTKYAAVMNWTVYKVYTDPGYSGANTNRPGLQAMLKDVRDGKIDKVVVYKLDRLSRSQKDTMLLIEDEFLANGVDFVSISENFDTGSAFGRAMIGILAVFAQLERENIKERTKMGKEARARSGKFHGSGTAPIGYQYDAARDLLVVDEYVALQVRELYALFLAGTPLRRIETLFKEKGYRHRFGEWSPLAMRRVMTNGVNVGLMPHNGEYYPAEHEPIIDRETYDKAVALLGDRHKAFLETGIRPGAQTTYLGGLLYCKHCGGKYTKQRGGSNKYGILYYYVCYSRGKKVKKMIKDPNCINKNWRMADLDEIVFNEIRKLALDPEYAEEIRRERSGDAEPDRIQILEAEADKLSGVISRYMDLYALGTISVDQISEKISEVNQRRDAILGEIADLREESDTITPAEATEIATSFDLVLDRGDFSEIRLVIESLIDRIELDNDDVYIYWKFA